MKSLLRPVLAIMAAMLLPTISSAQSCTSVPPEVGRAVHASLPAASKYEPFVAKVRVLAASDTNASALFSKENSTPLAVQILQLSLQTYKVEVIEPIRGFEAGEILTVNGGVRCNDRARTRKKFFKIGDVGYVAGQKIAKGIYNIDWGVAYPKRSLCSPIVKKSNREGKLNFSPTQKQAYAKLEPEEFCARFREAEVAYLAEYERMVADAEDLKTKYDALVQEIRGLRITP